MSAREKTTRKNGNGSAVDGVTVQTYESVAPPEIPSLEGTVGQI